MYTSFEEFKQALLSYLQKQKLSEELDIESNKKLTPSEKEEVGLRICRAELTEASGQKYRFRAEVNNTKMRPGDRASILIGRPTRYIGATVLENFFNEIILETPAELRIGDRFDIEASEVVMLQSIIQLIDSIEDGAPGSFFLKELAGLEDPYEGIGAIPFDDVTTFPKTLNKQQFAICKSILQRPTLACIQGPPGTGKTDVLATLANTFSAHGLEVLILSLTHQAVNNALNKVRKASLANIIKVGQELKAEDLSEGIVKVEKYGEYIKSRKDNRKGNPLGADIVGMTIHSSVMNLGLRKSGFNPSIVLVDEASQIPVTLAATIGAIGCGCVVFIGDDKQMPPIFHEKLVGQELSQSVFSYLANMHPEIKMRLSVTYRMNDKITEIVSRNFYEPYGEKLMASDFSKDRILTLHSENEDERIRSIFNNEESVIFVNPTNDLTWEDENPEEANFIAKIIQESYNLGMMATDLAVITPYRRQVKAIRTCANDILEGTTLLPVIDTVERLQGQDVDMIILSFCVSSSEYFIKNREFLLNPNRLNVMLSRAKKKVIIVGSKIVSGNMVKLTSGIN